jgi:hypothetical protein
MRGAGLFVCFFCLFVCAFLVKWQLGSLKRAYRDHSDDDDNDDDDDSDSDDLTMRK